MMQSWITPVFNTFLWLTLLSHQGFNGFCCFFDAIIISHIQMQRCEFIRAALLQLNFSLLRVAASDDTETLRVQVLDQEIPKPCVTARDVHKLLGFIGNSSQFSEPPIDIEEDYNTCNVQEHFCKRKCICFYQKSGSGFMQSPQIQQNKDMKWSKL